MEDHSDHMNAYIGDHLGQLRMNSGTFPGQITHVTTTGTNEEHSWSTGPGTPPMVPHPREQVRKDDRHVLIPQVPIPTEKKVPPLAPPLQSEPVMDTMDKITIKESMGLIDIEKKEKEMRAVQPEDFEIRRDEDGNIILTDEQYKKLRELYTPELEKARKEAKEKVQQIMKDRRDRAFRPDNLILDEEATLRLRRSMAFGQLSHQEIEEKETDKYLKETGNIAEDYRRAREKAADAEIARNPEMYEKYKVHRLKTEDEMEAVPEKGVTTAGPGVQKVTCEACLEYLTRAHEAERERDELLLEKRHTCGWHVEKVRQGEIEAAVSKRMAEQKQEGSWIWFWMGMFLTIGLGAGTLGAYQLVVRLLDLLP